MSKVTRVTVDAPQTGVGSRQHYLTVSWAGTHLLEKYKLTDYGQWKILGEDPNCDMGGSHHQPDLGIYEGTLSDIIDFAITLPQWASWGGGGTIEKVKVKKVLKPMRYHVLMNDKRELEKKLAIINEELGED